MRIRSRLGAVVLSLVLPVAGCDSPTSIRPGLEYRLVSSSGNESLQAGTTFFLADRIIQLREFSTATGPRTTESEGRYRIVRDSLLEVSWIEPATWIRWGVFRGDTLELQLIGAGDWPIRETYVRRR